MKVDPSLNKCKGGGNFINKITKTIRAVVKVTYMHIS